MAYWEAVFSLSASPWQVIGKNRAGEGVERRMKIAESSTDIDNYLKKERERNSSFAFPLLFALSDF